MARADPRPDAAGRQAAPGEPAQRLASRVASLSLLVPTPVVEVGVVVGHLLSLDPVDGDARAGVGEYGGGIRDGVHGRGAAHRPDTAGVGGQGGMAPPGVEPDLAVVIGDVGAVGRVEAGGDEQQPELAARSQPAWYQLPAGRDHHQGRRINGFRQVVR